MTGLAMPGIAVAHPPARVVDAACGAVLQLLPIVLDTALKGALLVGLVGAATVLLRVRSAARRHALWAAAVLAHLALPVLTLAVPGVRIPGLPLLPAPPWLLADPAPLGPGADGDPRGAALAAVAVLWLAGALLVGLRLTVGTWELSRLAGASTPVLDGRWADLTRCVASSLGIARPVTLRRGSRLAVPITWGLASPVVLLPADADLWPEDRRRVVLVHELAHVRRYDTLTQTLAQCAVALFWFDPLLWLAAWRLRVERERACDDVVLRDGAVPSRYAGALLDFARSRTVDGRAAASPGVAALTMTTPQAGRAPAFGASEFAARLEAILDPARDRAGLTRRTVVAGVIALGLVTPPLAAFRPFRAPPTPRPERRPAPAVAATRTPPTPTRP
ncbi:hypothetical protein tb265_47450 [Gemmatimonadetes bacterium T265]|nr:hypothetical protein tb265_47450 [Gemmatimonadetes bacterium T265]